MVGQEGDDTYYIDSSGDQTIESYPTFGIDHAITSVNRTISTNVENLTLVGAAVLGSGNATGQRAHRQRTGQYAERRGWRRHADRRRGQRHAQRRAGQRLDARRRG
ncbi:MAG: hypothetical protein MZW92_55210 [Comamonadaceae bacterium]|nr:hypothetical protein [Comamonadaceae bacterium]